MCTAEKNIFKTHSILISQIHQTSAQWQGANIGCACTHTHTHTYSHRRTHQHTSKHADTLKSSSHISWSPAESVPVLGPVHMYMNSFENIFFSVFCFVVNIHWQHFREQHHQTAAVARPMRFCVNYRIMQNCDLWRPLICWLQAWLHYTFNILARDNGLPQYSVQELTPDLCQNLSQKHCLEY